MNQNKDHLLTEREAGAFLKISRGTLSNWRSESRGPKYCKIGGAIRYPMAELTNFVNESMITIAE